MEWFWASLLSERDAAFDATRCPTKRWSRRRGRGSALDVEAVGKQLTADSGYHTEANMKILDEEKIDGYIADSRFRKRDPRFATCLKAPGE